MAKDSLEFYRQTIETVLRKYAEIPYSAGEIKQNLIIDGDRNHFMLFDVGWMQKRR
ncbi:MAG: element excision factor XisI family protein, partial [Pseudanabaena sp.]